MRRSSPVWEDSIGTFGHPVTRHRRRESRLGLWATLLAAGVGGTVLVTTIAMLAPTVAPLVIGLPGQIVTPAPLAIEPPADPVPAPAPTTSMPSTDAPSTGTPVPAAGPPGPTSLAPAVVPRRAAPTLSPSASSASPTSPAPSTSSSPSPSVDPSPSTTPAPSPSASVPPSPKPKPSHGRTR